MEGVDREFLAWLAGFWEGEGSLLVKRYRRNRIKGAEVPIETIHRRENCLKLQCDLSIAQKDKTPLLLIQSKLGGRIQKDYSSSPRNRFSRSVIHVWHLNKRKEIVELMENLLPFLKFRASGVIERLKRIEAWDKEVWYHARWEPREEEVIRENQDRFSDSELTRLLPRRTWRSIKNKRKKLGYNKSGWYKTKVESDARRSVALLF